jgi:uncharacterized protein
MSADMEGRLIDNAGQERYELWLGDTRVSVIEYESGPGLVTLIHTEVDPSFEGRGFAGKLIAGAIGDIRARGLKLAPACSFVRAYLRRHPEDRDVLQDRLV